jgi:hypothetical protein
MLCCDLEFLSGEIIVPHCSNRGGHVFPKDEKLKKKWIKVIKRNMDRNKYQLWNPTKTSVVCKLHFLPSDYLSETTCSGK